MSNRSWCHESNEQSHPLPADRIPAPVLTHQSGATAIDWSVYRRGHIALFRKPVSISRHLGAQPQVFDQYTLPLPAQGRVCERDAASL